MLFKPPPARQPSALLAASPQTRLGRQRQTGRLEPSASALLNASLGSAAHLHSQLSSGVGFNASSLAGVVLG